MSEAKVKEITIGGVMVTLIISTDVAMERFGPAIHECFPSCLAAKIQCFEDGRIGVSMLFAEAEYDDGLNYAQKLASHFGLEAQGKTETEDRTASESRSVH